jgi:hypothetical protein
LHTLFVDAVPNKVGKNPQVEVSVIWCQLPPRDWISCSFIDHVLVLEVHTVSSSKGDGWTIGLIGALMPLEGNGSGKWAVSGSLALHGISGFDMLQVFECQ